MIRNRCQTKSQPNHKWKQNNNQILNYGLTKLCFCVVIKIVENKVHGEAQFCVWWMNAVLVGCCVASIFSWWCLWCSCNEHGGGLFGRKEIVCLFDMIIHDLETQLWWFRYRADLLCRYSSWGMWLYVSLLLEGDGLEGDAELQWRRIRN